MDRLDRRFRWSIVAATLLAVASLVAATRAGRDSVRRLALELRVGIASGPGRRARQEFSRRDRIDRTRALYRAEYSNAPPALRRLLDHGGLDPERALLRWGNYDHTLLLASTVFESDDSGRSYRMRPATRAVWVSGLSFPGHLSGFFLLPDTGGLSDLARAAGGFVVAGSSQTTNAWGLRGPEPDVSAPIRGIVLGDSNMQGLFLGDDETPPECLRRELERRLGQRVSIVNTGHLGYSVEQFDAALREYGDRVRPHFVVLSFCPNDFGEAAEVLAGRGDYDEGSYWLDRVAGYCRARDILLVATPIPGEAQVVAAASERRYPGAISEVGAWNSLEYCNPTSDFVEAFLRLRLESLRRGQGVSGCPLYNGHLGDAHFSAEGARVWGRALARRVALLLQLREYRR
jgi:lysophospholipase L1-like esterase